MTTIAGGTAVRNGYYFELSSWSLHPVATDGERLPGAAAQRYVYVPLLLVFVIAPLLGAAFLVFLPFIGFYLVGQAALRPVVGAFRRSATELAATVSPELRPGEAHLAGHAEADEAHGKGPAVEGDALEELERTIASSRAKQEKGEG